MNEQIEKIYGEACITAGYLDEREFLEKFAQMLIKKCARICIEKNVSNLDMDVHRNSGSFTVQDLATKSCGENLAKTILKEFGVEE